MTAPKRRTTVSPLQLLQLDILIQETEARQVRLERSLGNASARLAALMAMREHLT